MYWYHNDVSGMPRELTGAGGEIAWRAEYRVWANTLRVEHIATRTGEPVYKPLRYQGPYFDAGTGLHYNRFRYYDPDAGRFISHDPPGLAGGINLYQYAPTPLVWVDPLGLKCNEFASRNAAFRAAKRDAGIPMSQQPSKVEHVPLTDRSGKSFLGEDHLPINTREYTFTRPNGESIVIEDHSAGHIYGPPGTPGNHGPHINVRPISDTRNGTVLGTLEHYPF
ncbi:RHS repeat-associated core domain-containing protein [Cronobacter dublinensis]